MPPSFMPQPNHIPQGKRAVNKIKAMFVILINETKNPLSNTILIPFAWQRDDPAAASYTNNTNTSLQNPDSVIFIPGSYF